ncbi:MAG TPA: class I SAM-dependent methyltransferase [Vicinamibacterales bacterium]
MLARQIGHVMRTALRDGPAPLWLARRAIREFGAIQRTWELQSLVGEVRRLAPRVVVEIGTHHGGTLVCWAAVASASAHIVSIDMPTDDRNGWGTRDEDLGRVRARLKPAQRLTAIRGDSHAGETLARLHAALGGAAVDLLWVDGDHSLAGTKADFEMYGPLVRSGGVIAFHDVRASQRWPQFGSPEFWDTIKVRHRAHEYVADPRPGAGMGIGVIRV